MNIEEMTIDEAKKIRRKERKQMIYTDTSLNYAPLWYLIDFLEYTENEYPDIEYIVSDGRLKLVVEP